MSSDDHYGQRTHWKSSIKCEDTHGEEDTVYSRMDAGDEI